MTDIVHSLKVDDWGRLIASYEDAINLLMCDRDLTAIELEPSPELDRFNEMCRKYDKSQEIIRAAAPLSPSVADYHKDRSSKWLSPVSKERFWDELLEKCRTTQERERFILELEEFSHRGMLGILIQLHAMIETIDAAGVVRGVGRGSSVASFILYLMGVHFINPLDHDLPISEFLK